MADKRIQPYSLDKFRCRYCSKTYHTYERRKQHEEKNHPSSLPYPVTASRKSTQTERKKTTKKVPSLIKRRETIPAQPLSPLSPSGAKWPELSEAPPAASTPVTKETRPAPPGPCSSKTTTTKGTKHVDTPRPQKEDPPAAEKEDQPATAQEKDETTLIVSLGDTLADLPSLPLPDGTAQWLEDLVSGSSASQVSSLMDPPRRIPSPKRPEREASRTVLEGLTAALQPLQDQLTSLNSRLTSLEGGLEQLRTTVAREAAEGQRYTQLVGETLQSQLSHLQEQVAPTQQLRQALGSVLSTLGTALQDPGNTSGGVMKTV